MACGISINLFLKPFSNVLEFMQCILIRGRDMLLQCINYLVDDSLFPTGLQESSPICGVHGGISILSRSPTVVVHT
ncbi:hypothetical protein PanWU01x14_214780 [Parasponia andersonii]|uniref:Uncharacterized protein n=1 Tax=Parasponia andersonii TaxID=3476 RepID=A0A2P5BS90_PARAD|nr:hypothetical protein PanWU01x14_214780 [Parasponia andersonii]